MTAEQSFNEIGYKLVDNAIPNLSYSKIVNKKINKTESEKRTFWVVFDKTAKFWWAQENVERYMLKVLQYRTGMTVLIDTKLHNAIAQQVKELEW